MIMTTITFNIVDWNVSFEKLHRIITMTSLHLLSWQYIIIIITTRMIAVVAIIFSVLLLA